MGRPGAGLGCQRLFEMPTIERFNGWLELTIRVFPFGEDHILCQWTFTTLHVVPCHAEWNVDQCPVHLILYFHLSFPAQHQLQRLSQLQRIPVPLWFPVPDVVTATDATPSQWAFYFQGSRFPLVASSSLCKVHITLQELQDVVPVLCKVAFWFSGKVVNLHLDNNAAKSYSCSQGVTASFLFRRACYILNLSNKQGITLMPAYVPTHLSVKADYLSWRRLVPEWWLPSHISQTVFQFGVNLRWICWHPNVPINVSIIEPWKIHYLWEPWSWILSAILGNIKWVMCFLLLH